MIDLHTHTFFSDGVLLPSELIQRARKMGYRAIGIADHADISNIEFVVKNLTKVCRDMGKAYKDIICLPGVELTHIPPVLVSGLVKKARSLGAKIVVFHGETVTEPVEPGSNRAAIDAKVDILAHPGNITDEDAALAAKNNVYLEITARNGHNITNKHVAQAALKAGAKLVFDTDGHAPSDLADAKKRESVLAEAGLNKGQILQVIRNSETLLISKGFKI
ncbi:MAG TPA: histidinol phosphate phosphatase domain-containing protein [Candidatus Goldiibacteriota bacterium]|nr:histidinol phosphate phosphatase domain-containing protein [Candidatus Goldiibacteriota bacterium]HRQ42928.1 histidinol phosphate phosphatase domain-containing protein [Candidatus Goldiibacteriota bacterium]